MQISVNLAWIRFRWCPRGLGGLIRLYDAHGSPSLRNSGPLTSVQKLEWQVHSSVRHLGPVTREPRESVLIHTSHLHDATSE
jgi:hypothetical protein